MGTPESEIEDEGAVTDEKDRPVLRSARACGADVLLTGDKDLLESGLTDPTIIDAGGFLRLQRPPPDTV